MDFQEYQKKAISTALPSIEKNIYYYSLGLSGEAGEVCNKIKKILRDRDGVVPPEVCEDLSAELGDVMWYVAGMCSVLGLSLEDVCSKNIDKLFSRKDRGVISGSGDNR